MGRSTLRIWCVVAAAVLCALAASETRRVFERANGWGLTVVVCAASALAALGLRTDRLRVRVPVHIIVVFVMTGLAVASEHGRLPLDVLVAPVKGLSDVMGARWPVPVTAPSLAFVVLLCGAVASVTVELARSGRFRSLLLLPPIALLGLVALLGAPAGPPAARSLSAVAAVAVVVLWTSSQFVASTSAPTTGVPRVMMGRRGRLPVGAPLVAVLGLVAAVLPAVLRPVLHGASRFDPRATQVVRSREVEDISPLARLDEFRSREPAVELFSVDRGGFSRFRLVGLTRYDGQAWMPSADYRPTGRNLGAVTSPSIRATITVSGLRERWVPWPGEIEAISTRVSTDGASSGLLLDERTSEGERIDVDVRRPTPGAESGALDSARAPTRPPAISSGTNIPTSVTLLAISVTAGATSDFERATRIEQFLKNSYQLDSQSIAGHTMALLQVFLDQTKRGRDEQFVAAFGVLAAAAGLPVRVVVGFDATPDPATGAVTVTSRDITAWPEVDFGGLGWVAFDPVPAIESPPAASVTDDQAPADPTGPGAARPSPSSSTPAAAPPDQPPVEPERSTRRSVPTAVLVAAGVTLVPLALVGLYAAAVLLVKRRRRRRLGTGHEADRAVGAFLAAMDVVVDLGGTALPTHTDSELVDRSPPTLLVSGQLSELAVRSTNAVYASRRPDTQVADEAWTIADEFTQDALGSVGRLRRIVARLSLRSLRVGLPRR